MNNLFIWSETTPDMGKLTAALRSLDLPFKVDQPQKAFPACSKRVLAVGSKPPFLVDYAYADDWDDPHLALKLAWTLEARQVSSGPVLIAEQLSEIMGLLVRELTQGEINREIARQGILDGTTSYNMAFDHVGSGFRKKEDRIDKKTPKFVEVEEE